MRAVAAALIALAAVGAALAADSPESPEWRPRGAALRGDVTGDGKPETAVIEYRGRPSCDFRLVVGSLIARVRPEICKNKPAEGYTGPDPHVAVLAPLDRQPGLEIVVQLGHGAHTEFADIWTVRDGELRRFAGHEPHLSYGGSVGTGSHVVDCARKPGVMLISTRVYDPPARVIRRWYRVRGLRLRPVGSRTVRWPAERAVTFREFGYPQPFPTCAKARAPR
jgi:hypothetical protein